MTSPVISTDARTARQDDKDTGIKTCDVCAHDAEGHDPISRRYCAATLANALSRECICR